MLDVDCKDRGLGISCPPPSFVELEFICLIRNCLSSHGNYINHWMNNLFIVCAFHLKFHILYDFFYIGLFLLNLVCRNEEKRTGVLENLKESFPSVQTRKIKGEVNEIIVCSVTTNKTAKK